jgi:hypothetical protein
LPYRQFPCGPLNYYYLVNSKVGWISKHPQFQSILNFKAFDFLDFKDQIGLVFKKKIIFKELFLGSVLSFFVNSSRPCTNMSSIVSCMAAILQFFIQMWILLKTNLGYFLLLNYRNKHLGLFCASRAKLFSNQHIFQWWCETSHMPIFETPITNQHSNNFCKLLTQHQHSLVGIITKDGST